MKKVFFCTLLSVVMVSCGHHGHDHEHEGHDHESEMTAEGESHDHDKEPDGIIVVHDEIAERFGVRVDSVTLAPIKGSIHSSAVISRAPGAEGVVSAPTAGVVRLQSALGSNVTAGATVATINASAVTGGDRNRVARVALDAAQAEVNRLKPLYDERLVTAAEYQSALAALEQAKAEYSPGAASGRASAPIGGTVVDLLVADGSYVEAGAPIARIASDCRLTLTAKTGVENYAALRGVNDARIVMSDGRSFLLSDYGAKTGGISADSGYASVTFTFNNDGSFAPGATLDAFLLTNESEDAISLPLGSIIEQQGSYFVYKEVMDEHFIKIPVKLGASDGERVSIVSGVNPGDRIVTAGVITVRLAESSGAIPSGHNHSH